MEKIHQWVLPLKRSNDELKIASAVTLKKSHGDIWRAFQVFRVIGGMEFSKHNTTFRLNSANLISLKKKKQRADAPQSLANAPCIFHRRWGAITAPLPDSCCWGLAGSWRVSPGSLHGAENLPFPCQCALVQVCNPLVLFHRKLVSSMGHRFFLPRKGQVRGAWEAAFSVGVGCCSAPVTTCLAGPVHWLGDETMLGALH